MDGRDLSRPDLGGQAQANFIGLHPFPKIFCYPSARGFRTAPKSQQRVAREPVHPAMTRLDSTNHHFENW
jgi:hypothetical protein